MSITNISKPTPSVTNQTRINIGETWNSVTTTWATETRTWNDMASLMNNYPKTAQTYLWGVNSFPWLEQTPWETVYSGITNIAKP